MNVDWERGREEGSITVYKFRAARKEKNTVERNTVYFWGLIALASSTPSSLSQEQHSNW